MVCACGSRGLQEYCNGGSLTSMALQWQLAGEGDVQMFERLTLLVDVARGLKHLHSRDIIHGDLVRNSLATCAVPCCEPPLPGLSCACPALFRVLVGNCNMRMKHCFAR